MLFPEKPSQAELSGPVANGTPQRTEDDLERTQRIERTLVELRHIYLTRVAPVEWAYEYELFQPGYFTDTVVQGKPFVTFLGPFSSGKSTFVNYLLQSEVMQTGPQPLTDSFNVIMYGEEAQSIPGRVLLSDPNLPFRGLNQFGHEFADNFMGQVLPHPILRSINIIDTPGVLETAVEARSRRYDYTQVIRWFVERSDLVLFLFDPTKLDAGAELRSIFKSSLKGQESKIRIVLNKADTVHSQELVRVYGALFWNMSNLVNTSEPPRVYVSSFWDRPYQPDTNHELFKKEKDDLLHELMATIPQQSMDRRVAAVVQRATRVLSWALVCATYRSSVPAVFGKEKAKKKFFMQYPEIARDLASRYRLSVKDFPELPAVRSHLVRVPSHKYPSTSTLLKRGWVGWLQEAIEKDLPALFALMRPLDAANAGRTQ